MTEVGPNTLVFIGPMGAGKTSVGRRVARLLELPFCDTDKLVARDHGPIPEIFATAGEARFRELEREAVVSALTEGGVVALGGGAVLNPDTQADLTGARVVLLTMAPHVVASRITAGDRPLLASEDPVARWQRIYDERRPVYERVADVVFDTSALPMMQVAADIAAWASGDAGAGSDAGSETNEEQS